jgi:cyclopropane fatty-acyl-phospholipid synthase-like methyltransferase
MNPNQDAYGQSIRAYFMGEESFEAVEREDRFISLSSGPKAYFAKYDDWQDHQKTAIKFVKGRVLDIGCGAGRHSLYLQQKGFDVTGIDNSPLAQKVCQERELKHTRLLPASHVHQFPPNSFDTILMLGNNFGLMSGFKKARSLLKKLHRITSADARIIAESTDPYQTDNPNHLEYQQKNRARGRMGGQIRIRIRFQKYIGEWFNYLLASRDEMKEIVEGAGWQVKSFIDSDSSVYIGFIEKV